jgi:hypothetical protein
MFGWFFDVDLLVTSHRKAIGKWSPLKAVSSLLLLLFLVSPALITSPGPTQKEENKRNETSSDCSDHSDGCNREKLKSHKRPSIHSPRTLRPEQK